MKNVRSISLFAAIALAAITPSAYTQIITRDFTVIGQQGPQAKAGIHIEINATTNTYSVAINNTLVGATGNVGTITGFGFNLPSTLVASQYHDANSGSGYGGSILVTPAWTQVRVGHNLPAITSTNRDDYWSESTPFSLGGSTFTQDYGVSTTSLGASSKGIQFGEKATFVFQFTTDFTAADLAGFFDNSFNPNTNSNRDYDFSVRWQQVSPSHDYLSNCAPDWSDKGGWDGFVPDESELPPTPEPSTYGLIGAASLLGLVARRRFMQAKKSAS